MAKLCFPLGLFVVLLSILSSNVSGIPTLDQLFTIQSGGSNGGCDAYFDQTTKTGTLNNWLIEINYALDTAIKAIDNYDPKVQTALTTFFGIKSAAKPPAATLKIRQILQYLLNFFSGAVDANNVPLYSATDRYLFCASTFLVEQAPDAPALDFEAKNIKDDDGDIVTIADVPQYKKALNAKGGNKIWWAGTHTTINGYYVSPTGGDFCDTLFGPKMDIKSLGLTSFIVPLKANAKPSDPVENIVLCPETFTNGKPKSYTAGNALITAGKNLGDVLPQSVSLLHEAFHSLFGVSGTYGMLQVDEVYDLIDCIDSVTVGKAVKVARKNPESYVFFITHMFYLYGSTAQGITTNWDFEVITMADGNRVYGAVSVAAPVPPVPPVP